MWVFEIKLGNLQSIRQFNAVTVCIYTHTYIEVIIKNKMYLVCCQHILMKNNLKLHRKNIQLSPYFMVDDMKGNLRSFKVTLLAKILHDKTGCVVNKSV